MDDADKLVEIKPDAWEDLYALLKPFIMDMAAWGQKHDQPMAVAIGVMIGTSKIMGRMGNACGCAACEAVSDAIADELVERMLEPMNAVRH